MEYKNSVENDLNKKIKILRTDNGKEYANKIFEMYLIVLEYCIQQQIRTHLNKTD